MAKRGASTRSRSNDDDLERAAATMSRQQRAAARSKKMDARRAAAVSTQNASDGEDAAKPTPKRTKTGGKKASAKAKSVTPSPVQAPRHEPLWTAHDELLKGDQAISPREVGLGRCPHFYDRLASSADKDAKDFRLAVEKMMKEPFFSEPYYGEDERWCFTSKDKWQRYAMVLSSYPKDRLEAVRGEFAKDRALHADLLRSLTDEIYETRVGGKRFYLRALNCQFFDAFARCHIPPPPLPKWALSIDPNMVRKDIYKMQLRAWDKFKSRAFAVLTTAAEHPVAFTPDDRRKIEPSKDVWLAAGQELPPITPVEHRGEMQPMKDNCMNEEKVMHYTIDWSKDKEKNEDNTGSVEEDDWDSPACTCDGCWVKWGAAKDTKTFWDDDNITESDDDGKEDENADNSDEDGSMRFVM